MHLDPYTSDHRRKRRIIIHNAATSGALVRAVGHAGSLAGAPYTPPSQLGLLISNAQASTIISAIGVSFL